MKIVGTAMKSRLIVYCLVAGIAAGCNQDRDRPIDLPEPPPPHVHQESEDWIKPGANVILRGGITYGSHANTFRVVNDDTFTWNLLDDVRLGVLAPNVKVRQDGPYIGDGRHGWYINLRCSTPRTIPAGATVEVRADACHPTTYDPGAGALVTSYRIVAREGSKISGIEPATPLPSLFNESGIRP